MQKADSRRTRMKYFSNLRKLYPGLRIVIKLNVSVQIKSEELFLDWTIDPTHQFQNLQDILDLILLPPLMKFYIAQKIS